MNDIYKNVVHRDEVVEKILSLMLFLPALYYSIANLFFSFTLLYIITFILSAFAYYLLITKKPLKFFSYFAFTTIILSYSLLLNPTLFSFLISTNSIREFSLSKLTLLVFLYMPIFVLTAVKKINFHNFVLQMYKYSFIILPLNIIINYQRILSVLSIDYMTIAYEIVFWLFFCIIGALIRKNLWATVIIIPSILSVLTGGSRGAAIVLLFLLFFVLIYKVFIQQEKQHNQFRKYFIFTLLFGFLLLFILNFSPIISQINNLLDNFGISSRTLNYLESSEILFDESRTVIFKEAISRLFDNFFGHGIFMDRLLLSSNQYVHNFFLELLFNYGLFVGFIMILIVVFNTFRAIRISIEMKNPLLVYMLIFSIVYIYIKFMISGSYLQSSEFFLALGVLFNISGLRSRRKQA